MQHHWQACGVWGVCACVVCVCVYMCVYVLCVCTCCVYMCMHSHEGYRRLVWVGKWHTIFLIQLLLFAVQKALHTFCACLFCACTISLHNLITQNWKESQGGQGLALRELFHSPRSWLKTTANGLATWMWTSSRLSRDMNIQQFR